MDSRIRKYCKDICKKQIEVLRFDKKTKSKFWDLPAMATICHDKTRNKFAKGKRSKIGKRYVIGNCAEQHAGNNYMNKFHENNIGNLYFMEAVRPRTMQVFPYCDNCKAIFPNL